MKFSVCKRQTKDGVSYFLRYRPFGYHGPQKAVALPGVRSHRQAEAARARYEAESANGVLPASSREGLVDYLERWLAGKRRLAFNSARAYQRMVALAGNFFGPLRLAELRRPHVEAWVSELEKSYAPSTVQTYAVPFKQALRDAVKDELIHKNPAEFVELPAPSVAEREAYNAAEIRLLLAACGRTPYPYGPLYATMLLAGLRIGEAIALPVDKVDLAARTLTVAVQQTRGTAGSYVEKPPKRGSVGTLAIGTALAPFLTSAIDAHQRVVAGALRPLSLQAHRRLFVTDPRGRLCEANRVRLQIYEIQAAAGVKRLVPHASRHTAGTLVVDATGDQRDAQQLLRHKHAQVTERYVHAGLAANARRAVAALDALLEEPTGT